MAARGIDALLFGVPGQGETRFAHGNLLSSDWLGDFRRAIDFLKERAPGHPIGIVGNSMGESLSMKAAAKDVRIRACCNNGGPMTPWLAPRNSMFFTKMMRFCDIASETEAVQFWRTVATAEAGSNSDYRLLLIQRREDFLMPNGLARMLYDMAPTPHERIDA